MQKKIVKGFSLLEILVALLIIGIVAAFSYPNLSKWIKDRETRANVNKFVDYLERIKSEVQSGKYALVAIGMYEPDQWTNQFYYMTKEEWAVQMKNNPPGRTNRNSPGQYNNKSILNNAKGCPGYPPTIDYQNWVKGNDIYIWPSENRMWPNSWVCFSKDAIIKPGGEHSRLSSTLQAWLIICSSSNTTTSNGNNRCNDRNKNDYRYAIKVSRSYKISVYKYHLKKDEWILQ